MNIFVQGLNPRTRSDSIRNFFESIGKPATVKDNILFNLEHTEALVIFQQRPGRVKIIDLRNNFDVVIFPAHFLWGEERVWECGSGDMLMSCSVSGQMHVTKFFCTYALLDTDKTFL